MVTLKQIASKCGVSVASVSKALNDAPDIGAETAARIKQTAREMGYFPNAAARALKTNRSHNIGVLFEDETRSGLTHEYFIEVLNSVKNEAEKSGYDVTFISKNVGGSFGGSYLEHCRYRNCDGAVVVTVDFKDPDVLELVQSNIPVVTLDYEFAGSSAVISDNTSGMKELLEYIYEQGHRDVIFIHGEDTAVTNARVAMFRAFFKEKGIALPEDHIIEGHYHDPNACAKATKKILAMEKRPSCIIYPDDISLLGGMSEIERAGLRIPEDISVAGYDGIRLSRMLRPTITTYHQDSETLGLEAVKLLIEQIENPKGFVPQTKIVSGYVQQGKTVSKPSGI